MFSKKSAFVRGMEIGGSAPVRIQTMWDSPLPGADSGKIIERINSLSAMGCDIIRFSFVSEADAPVFTEICRKSPIPVVADIHFDYKMAIMALECGADKIRINPGNIGAKWKTEEVIRAASDKGAAIRIGLNNGSLPKNTKGLSVSDLMSETAIEYINDAESLNFTNLVISLKSSDTDITYEANRKFASLSPYPIHLGVTEAGSALTSAIRSTWTLGNLMKEHIGDTIRVSITGSLENEIQAATEILRTLKLRKEGIRIVSCPRCGRHSFDSQGFLSETEAELLKIPATLTVAIMGCQVNGPGEAKNADVAVTGIGNKVFLYRKGELYREVTRENAKEELFQLIRELM
jgi:1-hydroxy-2-methyl-2-(E)-butenyl 4-diphosphate synthase